MIPRISVITVVKNSESCIERTLQSVLSQDYSALEYIVVDGGSKDKTCDIIQQYTDRCLFYQIDDKNPTEGINYAFKHVSGDMLGFLNAGDWYEPHTLHDAARCYEQGAIIHGKMRIWNDVEPEYVVIPKSWRIYRRMCLNFPTCFFCRPLPQLVTTFDNRFDYATDYEYIRRCLEQGGHFHYVDQILANMSTGGRSVRHWQRALFDMHHARMAHGASAPNAAIGFVADLVHSWIRMVLEKCGLHGVVAWYRSHWAPVRKQSCEKKNH